MRDLCLTGPRQQSSHLIVDGCSTRQLPGCLLVLGVPRYLVYFQQHDQRGSIYKRHNYDELLSLAKEYFRKGVKRYPPHDKRYKSELRKLIVTYKRARYLIRNYYEPNEVNHERAAKMQERKATAQKRREMGLCPRCGGVPVSDGVYCAICQKKSREYAKKYYRDKKVEKMDGLIKHIETREHAKGLTDFLHFRRKVLIGELLDVEDKLRATEEKFKIKNEWYKYRSSGR